jgi:hypothetical protein
MIPPADRSAAELQLRCRRARGELIELQKPARGGTKFSHCRARNTAEPWQHVQQSWAGVLIHSDSAASMGEGE